MRQFLSLVMVAVACALFLALPGCDEHAEEKAAIRQVWDSLDASYNSSDGWAVTQLVTASTFPYYERLIGVAVGGTREQIERLPVIERLTVLNMRHRATAESIKDMDGREFLNFSTRSGWYAGTEDDDPNFLKLGDIIIDGDYARARAIVDGKKSGHWIHFIREDDSGEPGPSGRWRLNEPELDTLYNAFIPIWASEAGLSENELIIEVIGYDTPDFVRDDIWDRPS